MNNHAGSKLSGSLPSLAWRLRFRVRRLPLLRKLSLGFLIVLSLSIGVGVLAVMQTGTIAAGVRRLAIQDSRKTRDVTNLEIVVNQLGASTLLYLDTRDSVTFARIGRDRATLDRLVADYRGQSSSRAELWSADSLARAARFYQAAITRTVNAGTARSATMADLREILSNVDGLIKQEVRNSHGASIGRRDLLDRALDMDLAVDRLRLVLWKYIATLDPAMIPQLTDAENACRRALDAYVRVSQSPKPPARLEAIDRLMTKYLSGSAVLQSKLRGERQALIAFGSTRVRFVNFLEGSVRAELAREVAATVRKAETSARVQLLSTIGILLLGIGFSGGAGGWLALDVSRALSQLVGATRAMTRGELESHVQIDSVEEINELADAFNGMSLSLAKSRRLMEGSLDQLQRVNEAKSQFVSDVSHELRTPLTSVRGSLSLLANGAVAPESERGAMLIRIALSNTDRLIRLINERLDLDKIDAGELSLVSAPHRLNEIIRESMQGVGSLAEAKRIVVTVKGPMPFVLVDRDRSIQVLVNLLGNALKFSPPGARVLVTSMCTSEMVRISVRDEGPGMASEQQERLFQRFKQLGNEEWRGSGLGLAISRAIVEEHGGQIGFESSPGNGATFWFTLPLAAVRRLRAPAVA